MSLPRQERSGVARSGASFPSRQSIDNAWTPPPPAARESDRSAAATGTNKTWMFVGTHSCSALSLTQFRSRSSLLPPYSTQLLAHQPGTPIAQHAPQIRDDDSAYLCHDNITVHQNTAVPINEPKQSSHTPPTTFGYCTETRTSRAENQPGLYQTGFERTWSACPHKALPLSIRQSANVGATTHKKSQHLREQRATTAKRHPPL
ncbi:unnamed protein product [Ectocarpus sp. 8 AP-2014]